MSHDLTCGCPECERRFHFAQETSPSENPPMPKTTKERQDDFRVRRAMLEGAQEVRGIFLPKDLHVELKAEAKRLLKKRQKGLQSEK